MEFLSRVANYLLKQYGDGLVNDLSDVTVVLPSKRSSLFLGEELYITNDNRPLFVPRYVDMPTLMAELSEVEDVVADELELVCKLYDVFMRETHFQVNGSEETLDHFYDWGKVLLADFDDLDKNMGDAPQVFRNIADLHNLEPKDYRDFLDERQIEVLQTYFKDFNGDDNGLHQNFLKVWNKLAAIYTSFREVLGQEKMCYEGMRFREVADKVKNEEWLRERIGNRKVVFVGFNMLHRSEFVVVKAMQRLGVADVIWNYDNYFLRDVNQEAGVFLRDYWKALPMPEKFAREADQLSRKEKKVTYLKSNTEDAQARYVRQWLLANGAERLKAGKRTAIVLCDETLLPNVLHSLPTEEESKNAGVENYKLNVTMGYPLTQTKVWTFVNAALALCTTNRYGAWVDFMTHPYTRLILEVPDEINPLEDENAKARYKEKYASVQKSPHAFLFALLKDLMEQVKKGTGAERQLERESIYRVWKVLNRMGDLLAQQPQLYIRLLVKMIGGLSVPYHGEPAEGIQILGLLETRCLDFDHVLMLSCNEGNMPKSVDDTSFLPYIVRKAYGLTTIDNKVAVFAYYFYSLLRMATDVTYTYCDANDASTGQMKERSRFLMQLLVEKPDNIKIDIKETVSERSAEGKQELEQETKRVDAIEKPSDFQVRPLSPSALISYMQCGLKFYYAHVLRIPEPADLNPDDVLDANTLGSVFHEAAEMYYGPSNASKQADLGKLVDEAITKVYERSELPLPSVGIKGMLKRVVVKYLKRMIAIDEKRVSFRVAGREFKVAESPHSIEINGAKISEHTSIDRIDRDDNQDVWLIDYKTGTWHDVYAVRIGKGKNDLPNDPQDIVRLWDLIREGKKKANYYFQTIMYGYLLRGYVEGYKGSYPKLRLMFPASMKDLEIPDSDLFIRFEGAEASEWYAEFERFLKGLIDEITDIRQPFRAKTVENECDDKYCPFFNLCGRTVKKTDF